MDNVCCYQAWCLPGSGTLYTSRIRPSSTPAAPSNPTHTSLNVSELIMPEKRAGDGMAMVPVAKKPRAELVGNIENVHLIFKLTCSMLILKPICIVKKEFCKITKNILICIKRSVSYFSNFTLAHLIYSLFILQNILIFQRDQLNELMLTSTFS